MASSTDTARPNRINELNGKLTRDYRVIVACLMHGDALRRSGHVSTGAAGHRRTQAVLDKAQSIIEQIEKLGGTPAYQIKDVRTV